MQSQPRLSAATIRPCHLAWLAALLFLWLQLIRQLSAEWLINPQYSYGWAVPVLCAYLFWRDLRERGGNQLRGLWAGIPLKPTSMFAAVVLALCYAPIRLIQEANTDWRLVSWLLALDVLGLTWLAISPSVRSRRLSMFPLFFFLVAVPWPTVFEQPIIRALTGAMTNGAAAILGVSGIPALVHGATIETSSGFVGVDEGCSGIRSFQASLMLALFFGEFYRLGLKRRILSVAAALGFSFLFNLLRTTLLVMIGARSSYLALAHWHDPAGLVLPLACFACTWLLAFHLRGSDREERESSKVLNRLPSPQSISCPTRVASYCLLAWILCVELGTEGWYRVHERPIDATKQWHPVFESDLVGFRELGFPASARRILRFSEAINATWPSEDGMRWQAIYLRWNPSRVAACLARNHTPEDCLAAAGHRLVASSGLHRIDINGLSLPFRFYLARSATGPFHVFYCLWEDQAVQQTFKAEWLSYRNRLMPVLAGRRNSGQRSLELALWGAANDADAELALRRLLPKLIRAGN